jgi:hypothetical protein
MIVIMINDIILSVIMPSVIMLNVLAPTNGPSRMAVVTNSEVLKLFLLVANFSIKNVKSSFEGRGD